MIYWQRATQTWPSFAGGLDAIHFVRAEDPLVLENQVNAIGQAEANLSRLLGGIQIAGAGKGHQFMVGMLFSEVGLPSGNQFATGELLGLRAFCFHGETPEALERNKELARARMLAFTATWPDLDYRACEVAGANSGTVYMGLVLVERFGRE
jgi:hypothetical protein